MNPILLRVVAHQEHTVKKSRQRDICFSCAFSYTNNLLNTKQLLYLHIPDKIPFLIFNLMSGCFVGPKRQSWLGAKQSIHDAIYLALQSRQSSRFSIQSSTFSPPRDCCSPPPPLWVQGGRRGGRKGGIAGGVGKGRNWEETHSLAGEGGGGTQFRRWDRYSGTLALFFILLETFCLIYILILPWIWNTACKYIR